MEQIKEIVNKPKLHNKALAFIKVMRFYMRDAKYQQKYGKDAIESLFDFNEGQLANELVSFVRNSAQFFHQGLNFEYSARIAKRFS